MEPTAGRLALTTSQLNVRLDGQLWQANHVGPHRVQQAIAAPRHYRLRACGRNGAFTHRQQGSVSGRPSECQLSWRARPVFCSDMCSELPDGEETTSYSASAGPLLGHH